MPRLAVLLLAALAPGCAFLSDGAPERDLTPVPTPLGVYVSECGPAEDCVPDGPVWVWVGGGSYPCLGYRLVGRHVRRGTVARITLDGVEAPRGPCALAIGPARDRFGLDGAPLPETVEFVLDGRVDRYALRRDGFAWRLAPLDTAFTRPVNPGPF